MSNLKLQRLIDLEKLILKLRSVARITYNPGAGYENDVEHSFSLAFLAWLMAPKVAPHLDFYQLQTYAMIHDLVEVYAGDTFCFARASELRSKEHRESNALKRLLMEFSDFPELCSALAEYQKLANEEARFIYALDKLQPIILNYLDGGRVWQENNISFEQMFEEKLARTAVHPKIHAYCLELARLMQQDSSLFPVSKNRTENWVNGEMVAAAGVEPATLGL